jgi:hypothetical protein
MSERDFGDIPFERIKKLDMFLQTSTPVSALKANLIAFEALQSKTPNNAVVVALLTAIEIWLKTHVSIFKYLKQNPLDIKANQLPLEIHQILYESQGRNKPKGFGDLKTTAGHDLESLVKVLQFFTGVEQLQVLNENLQIIGERAQWIEGRYNSKRFERVDLKKLKSAFDKVVEEFKQQKIEVFERFGAQL